MMINTWHDLEAAIRELSAAAARLDDSAGSSVPGLLEIAADLAALQGIDTRTLTDALMGKGYAGA